jgi:hypothetical protein
MATQPKSGTQPDPKAGAVKSFPQTIFITEKRGNDPAPPPPSGPRR